MYRVARVLILVVCMAIWPFGSAGKAQDGAGGSSSRVLSERMDALERKIDRLEAKISRLENRSETINVGGDGAAPKPGFAAGGKGPCPGEWRKIGGGWVCTDPNAK